MAFHPELVFSPTSVVLNGFTQGSLLFVGSANNVSQDNANLFWDAANLRLGIGTALPQAAFTTTILNGAGKLGGLLVATHDFVSGTTGSTLSAYFGATSGNTYSVLQAGIAGASSAGNLNIISSALGINNSNPQASLTVGTTAATTRSYNSFVDASNGEWAYMGDWGLTANVATYGTDKNGTGTTRNLKVVVGGVTKLDYGITSASKWTFIDQITINGSQAALNFQARDLAQTWGLYGNANKAHIYNGASDVWTVDTSGLMTLSNTILLATSVSLTNGAAAAVGSLTNAPVAGNPTKWIPINDNGTTRYLPAW